MMSDEDRKERKKILRRKYYLKHQIKLRADTRKYNANLSDEEKEKKVADRRDYYLRHQEALKDVTRKHYANLSDEEKGTLKEYHQKYNSNHRKNRSAASSKWHRTFVGYTRDEYKSILWRVRGKSGRSVYIYKGLPIEPKEKMISFLLNSDTWKKLWQEWVDAGYIHRLSPSVDRLDGNERGRKGYTFGNIQLVTVGENVRLAWEGRKLNDKKCI